MQTRAYIKYLIDIKNLYALYLCRVEGNVVEKTATKEAANKDMSVWDNVSVEKSQ